MCKCLFDYGYKPGDWYQDNHVGGIVLPDGSLDVFEEYGCSADFDSHADDVMNGLGYYDSDGDFVRYSVCED